MKIRSSRDRGLLQPEEVHYRKGLCCRNGSSRHPSSMKVPHLPQAAIRGLDDVAVSLTYWRKRPKSLPDGLA